MPKEWKARLRDTIAKVREDQGDAVADLLQGLIDDLAEPARKKVSDDLSIGYRLLWNRGDAETARRRGVRAAALTDSVFRQRPPLATAVHQAVTQIDYVHTLQELELRLLTPEQYYLGFIGGDGEDRTPANQYQWALNNTWANSCGGFSAALKRIVSSQWQTLLNTKADNEPQRSRAYVADRIDSVLSDIQNKYLRFDLGCHSFMVENLGSDCRVYQVYMAGGFNGYNFAEDLQNQTSLPRVTFIEKMRAVLTNQNAANQAGGAAIQLFRGTCWPSNNVRDGQVVCIEIERTTAPRTVAEMATEAGTMCGENHAAWQEALGFQGTVADYNQRAPGWPAWMPEDQRVMPDHV
jgi:hypothetical protein